MAMDIGPNCITSIMLIAEPPPKFMESYANRVRRELVIIIDNGLQLTV